MSLDNHALGIRIKSFRRKRGISQSKLSEIVDKSPTYISLIETGNKSMSLKVFVELANALGVSADELLMDSLDNITIVTEKIGIDWLADCDSTERILLLELLKMAKEVLRANKRYRKGAGE